MCLRVLAERWMKPGAEYAQSLPLDKEWYKNLDLGGMELPGSNGLDGPDMDHGEPPHTPPTLTLLQMVISSLLMLV